MHVKCARYVKDIPRPATRRVTAIAASLIGLMAASLIPAAGADAPAGKAGPAQAGVAADRALRNGAIYTQKGSRSWAQALAIRVRDGHDGQVLAVAQSRGVGLLGDGPVSDQCSFKFGRRKDTP